MHSMKVCITLTSALWVAGPAFSQEPADVEALKHGQPGEVASFISRAFECQHFLGEPGYDKARNKEIEKALKKWKCNHLDSDRAQLNEKYRNDLKVLNAIAATGKF
jgi:hypothetical protein